MKTAIITGGTKGLGRETALAFGRAGDQVIALYSSDEKAAEEMNSVLMAENLSGSVLRCNITSEEEVAAALNRPEIQQAESLTLIHNACAAFQPCLMHQLTWRDFESSYQVAIKGGWLCTQALIRPMLRAKRGTIVNVLTASAHGLPPKGFTAYVTAKHALQGLTLALVSEFSARGLRIFTVSPGFMQTSLTNQWDERLREAIPNSPARITKPAEAAKRIIELVKSDATKGCGEDYPV